jgi:hypothetical protein
MSLLCDLDQFQSSVELKFASLRDMRCDAMRKAR